MACNSDIRALVIGANGLIGRRMTNLLSREGIKWLGTYNKRPETGLHRLNITSAEELKDIFSKFLPNAVFHCANLTGGVDFCESNPKEATDFHLNATKYIGTLCKDMGAKLVFISTDYVFDGLKETYSEEDAANPLSTYGRLKLKSEEWIKQHLSRYLIVRTTNVFGWDPATVTPNYIMNLYLTLKNKKAFNAASFLWGSPTYVDDLVYAIFELVTKNATGVFHIVGSSFVNRFEWAGETCDILGLDKSLINEVKEPSPGLVPRPLKSRLSTERFTANFESPLHNVSDGLKLMKLDIENTLKK